MKKFNISVPASSANIGPGFDSAGIALNRYLTLEVTEQNEWEFEHKTDFLPSLTDYKDHLIYQIARQTAERYQKQLSPCNVTVTSDIPLTRGLGSSASAVLAGIELANQLCDLSLTAEQKLYDATDVEGHPDNVAASLFGGIVITTATQNEQIDYVRLPDINVDVVTCIPDFELKTETARNVLPTSFSRQNAARASAVSNVMIAALLTGDYKLAGKMMESDLFHEPYRAELIPNFERIRQLAKAKGAYGTVISGAGPTMISFVPKGDGTVICEEMKSMLSGCEAVTMEINQTGLQVSCT